MAVVNHTGQVVTDLARARRFYEEVLGFRLWFELELPDEPSAQLLALPPPLGMKVAYLVSEGFVLELIQHTAPGATEPVRRRTMAEPGLTHLSFAVDDIHETAAKAVEHGGELVEGTDIGLALFLRDPDGQLLELLPSSYRDQLPPKP
jgi:catechol 2,3-dioxygenase-like lactoylglutathione lyase family enzyme